MLVGWGTSALGPFSADIGVPALNSLLTGAIVYWVAMSWFAKARKQDNVHFRQVSHLD